MKRFLPVTAVSVACSLVVTGQAASNWTTFGGDAQHSGWERNDPAISKDKVKDLQLLWKMKLENQPKGLRPIMPPLIIGRLISYRGFKELAIVATGSDVVYAIDADLGKMFWQKHLEYSVAAPQATGSCAVTAMPTMPPPPAGRGGPGGAAPPAGAGRGGSAFIGGGGPASVYAISSDGRLHRLNVSTGDDMAPPLSVLPANAGASSLNMVDNVIYTVTGSCNNSSPAVWAIDLSVDPPKVTSFALSGGDLAETASPVVGTDGAVYAQASASLVALSPHDLKMKKVFAGTSARASVFSYKGRDLIAMARDGNISLLDSASPDAPTVSVDGRGIEGNLSTWEDPDGTRWVLAPVWGPHTSAPNGSIVAFKVEEQNGKPTLTPAWVSRDMSFPQPPVIASGIVFALSSGKNGTHATLYALDAATGKELYSSRNLVTAPAALAGMTVANGRVYFGTTDGTFYTFGMFMEH